jgi:hypothetical protein
MRSTRHDPLHAFRSGICFAGLLCCIGVSGSLCAGEAVMARYVRIENPAGQQMALSALEVFSNGVDVALHHPEYFSGTGKDPEPPDRINRSEGRSLTSGEHPDTKRYGQEFRGFPDPISGTLKLNPWFELDFGKPIPIEKIVLSAANFPRQEWGDQKHRVITVLDGERKVVWGLKWNALDTTAYPTGVFTFVPTTGEQNPLIGRKLAPGTVNWVPMGWLLDAEAVPPLPDAERRMQRFAARNSPAAVERLARRLFAQLDKRRSDLAPAFQAFAAGKYQDAMDAWKKAWFAKMKRVNLHVAVHRGFLSYPTQGDDLVDGVEVTIGNESTVGARYIPGQMHWIDIPKQGDPGFWAAMNVCENKGMVGKTSRPLLDSYGRNPDPKYITRWAEIMDDWAMNYFADAQKTPYEAENIFVMNQSAPWGTMMEDLSDLAVKSPALVDLIPATALARVQLICLEKYGSAWIYQDRYTTFIHLTSGIKHWDMINLYLDDLLPGQRLDAETRQATERWIEMCMERDGSTVDIGDEGHMEYSPQVGFSMSRLDLMKEKPAWYTAGWRNRFNEFYDNIFKYFLRHTSPGGFDHRDSVAYRGWRFAGTAKYYRDWTTLPVINHDQTIQAIPEVRRILDALGHVSSGVSTDPLLARAVEQQKESREDILAALGTDKPGAPHINSDWMPYTGSYYFRSGWNDKDAFIAMLACGSGGGSSHPFPYDMFYHYDYLFPLSAAQPIRVDGRPPQQLYGRWRSFEPGSKIDILTYAQEKPLQHRWLSDARFDVGEAIFHGAYQHGRGFTGDIERKLQEPEPVAVTDMTATRQILQVRGSRLFIITDTIASPDQKPHDYSLEYKLALSTKKKGASTPFSPDQLVIDNEKTILRTANPDGPSVALYQFADLPITYRKGGEAKPDFGYYASRLGSDIGIANQQVTVEFKGPKASLVTLLSSSDTGTPERVASVERMDTNGAVGFHAVLKEGGDLWYQAATAGSAALVCGPGTATGQALLVVKDKEGLSGIALSAKDVSLGGKAVKATTPDFEFVVSGGTTQITGIYTPIDPVRFEPNRNAFIDTETVTMVSDTPGIEIRYTTDGTPPTRTSTLYTGPVKITESTEFAARAYRLGADKKPLPADDFEINGTKFTVPTYGWFYKKALAPAVEVAAATLEPGLNYDYLDAPWWTLFTSGHWLPAAGGGTVERELDLSPVSTNDSYGMRYRGYIKIPEDGLYTFQPPKEFISMERVAGYDLHLYIDGEDWYLTQWFHGQGTWTVPLAKGFHTFQVDFAEQRTKPYRKSGCWNYYPRANVLHEGPPTDILVSGPGLEATRIPKEWLYRTPEARTFPDERVLVDAGTDLHSDFDGAVTVPLAEVGEVAFLTTGKPAEVFKELRFTKADGSEQAFAAVAAQGRPVAAGVVVDLGGGYKEMSGRVHADLKLKAKIVYRNPAGTSAQKAAPK